MAQAGTSEPTDQQTHHHETQRRQTNEIPLYSQFTQTAEHKHKPQVPPTEQAIQIATYKLTTETVDRHGRRRRQIITLIAWIVVAMLSRMSKPTSTAAPSPSPGSA